MAAARMPGDGAPAPPPLRRQRAHYIHVLVPPRAPLLDAAATVIAAGFVEWLHTLGGMLYLMGDAATAATLLLPAWPPGDGAPRSLRCGRAADMATCDARAAAAFVGEALVADYRDSGGDAWHDGEPLAAACDALAAAAAAADGAVVATLWHFESLPSAIPAALLTAVRAAPGVTLQLVQADAVCERDSGAPGADAACERDGGAACCAAFMRLWHAAAADGVDAAQLRVCAPVAPAVATFAAAATAAAAAHLPRIACDVHIGAGVVAVTATPLVAAPELRDVDARARVTLVAQHAVPLAELPTLFLAGSPWLVRGARRGDGAREVAHLAAAERGLLLQCTTPVDARAGAPRFPAWHVLLPLPDGGGGAAGDTTDGDDDVALAVLYRVLTHLQLVIPRPLSEGVRAPPVATGGALPPPSHDDALAARLRCAPLSPLSLRIDTPTVRVLEGVASRGFSALALTGRAPMTAAVPATAGATAPAGSHALPPPPPTTTALPTTTIATAAAATAPFGVAARRQRAPVEGVALPPRHPEAAFQAAAARWNSAARATPPVPPAPVRHLMRPPVPHRPPPPPPPPPARPPPPPPPPPRQPEPVVTPALPSVPVAPLPLPVVAHTSLASPPRVPRTATRRGGGGIRRHVAVASDDEDGGVDDYAGDVTLLLDGATGDIAAAVLASLGLQAPSSPSSSTATAAAAAATTMRTSPPVTGTSHRAAAVWLPLPPAPSAPGASAAATLPPAPPAATRPAQVHRNTSDTAATPPPVAAGDEFAFDDDL